MAILTGQMGLGRSCGDTWRNLAEERPAGFIFDAGTHLNYCVPYGRLPVEPANKSIVQTSSQPTAVNSPAERARFVRDQLPAEGLFAGHQWRVATSPLRLATPLAKEIETLGRVLLQFYRAVNLLYRKSAEGKQPEWVARWLDYGKPAELIALERSAAFKNEVPRVIRPDLLITEHGLSVTELDSVPGGIGLTAWLNQVYSRLEETQAAPATTKLLGGPKGMLEGFASIFGEAPHVHIVVSDEAATYRPEMEWVANQLGERFQARDSNFQLFEDGDAVYRFFELFDLRNVGNSARIFELAASKRIRLTPPPKPIFEEKMLFALLWNRNLQGFWRQELGQAFHERMLKLVPYTWIVDPSPLPPQGAIPQLDITDWRQLQLLSHKDRELILKVSGFSPHAWGARGVYLGSDLPQAEWAAAVDRAIAGCEREPHVLQRYHKPSLVETEWFDFESNQPVPMKGRARLCPYYFVHGEAEAARAQLGGVLATICPADKKIIHGMTEAVFAPCSA
ncbi:MAG TPA: hypothetical protein VKY92_21465 [Verrucomicrobiae bacterium]|nr:hypothetical protein [Verrucomicrobiae bacterium]